MEMTVIRYHPLIDGDSTGIDKVPLFLSTDDKMVKKCSKSYLSEIVPRYYRLYSKEPMNHKASDHLIIHCPLCGSNLRQIADVCNTTKLGLYTCSKCKR